MKRALGLLLTGCVLFGVPSSALAQDDENAPPEIDSVAWWIQRNLDGVPYPAGVFSDWEAFTPDSSTEAGIAHELDRIRATATISDADWAGTEDDQGTDEAVFVRLRGDWVPYRDYPPAGPPIPEADDVFQPEEGDGLAPPAGQTQLDHDFIFTIPPFEGKNQARLRGLITYDVAWRIELAVTNEQGASEDEEDGPVINKWFQTIYAKENPVLGPSNAPPFADAGADMIVELGTEVTLDATRTFDSFNLGFDVDSGNVFEKDQLTYAWEWISGPVRVDPQQADPYSPTATVTLNTVTEPEEAGVAPFVFRVTVNDDANAGTSSASVTVAVVTEIPDNHAPTAVVRASTSGPVQVGDIITLYGTDSVDEDCDPATHPECDTDSPLYDPDACDCSPGDFDPGQLTYYWRQTDELGGDLSLDLLNRVFQPLSGREEDVSTWQAVRAGTFYVRLLVGDGQLTDVSDVLSIEVVEPTAAGSTERNEDALPPPAADDAQQGLPAPLLCGAGAFFSLALVPLLLWPLRGRIRRP